MAQTETQKYAELLERKANVMLQMLNGIPENQLRRKPSADAWSVMEILCHVEEALAYWRLELERVVKNQGGEWGRGLQHEGRLAAVAKADQRQLDEVTAGLQAAAASCKATLSGLQDADLDLEAPHRNPKFGTKPMRFLIEHFITGHVENHIGQIERTLNAI